MPRDATATRNLLIDAAEQVFAEQGIGQSNLRDIHRLAGQANKSALHYHFGSRDRLLDAVLERHHAHVDPLRAALVARLRDTSGPPDIPAILDALVAPLAAQLSTPSGRNRIRIVDRMRHDRGLPAATLIPDDAAPELHWLFARLNEHLTHLPPAVREFRVLSWSAMTTGALADWARSGDTSAPLGFTTDELVVNLVAIGTAALTAPAPGAAPPHPANTKTTPASRARKSG
ncbi:TetR/AcrR family transcriptional regulator [Embleya sp. NPDC008237]|uniref:TetR/AcrR family transcriptional regulator n=1 Tax=Embleya sp. NPDC008237 TaxID=3363978 RepID=UPI0036E5B1E9